MSRTAIYHTTVTWKESRLGHIAMGNGPEMDFSAPPDSQGIAGVLTPEDAFVGSVNTCIMMMFLWACERLKIDLIGYTCKAEGTKMIELDRTETFTQVRLFPNIQVRVGGEEPVNIDRRVRKALASAQKYSLVANSIKSEVIVDPVIELI